MSRKYQTADAFRAALDARAKREAHASQRPLQRVINVYLMQRFIARVLAEFPETVTLKGGMALELRLTRARTTKDVDLRLSGGRERVLDRLRRRAQEPGGADWLTFTVEEDPDHPGIAGDGVIYEGVRLRAQANQAGKKYGAAFGVDIAVGDPMFGPRESRPAPNLLDIVGEPALAIPLYPLATHLAEKLHAYTLPRDGLNSRLKDLMDIALIASELSIDAHTLLGAFETTFAFRATHPVPSSLAPPPAEWSSRYPRERDAQRFSWASIEEVHAEAARFFDPILAGGGGTWDPAARAWTTAGG